MMTKFNTKTDALLDDLLQDCDSPEDILGEHGLLKGLTKRLVERALQAELTTHLGYAPHARHATNGNTRNGTSAKNVETDQGPVELAVPRDRAGTFEPTVVKKRQRRLEGFDDKVLALYAHGLTTREIQGHLEELYGTDVSPTLISTITDAVLEDVRLWQSRPLETVYPILYFDCLFVKSRHEGAVKTKAVYVALGVTLTGEKELLGLWVSETEGAKFWLTVFTELKQRGVKDCFVACVDGLMGLPEALETIFPQTQVQLCIVHKVRQALRYVVWKERRAVARDLRAIYGAATLAEAEEALECFTQMWDQQYPSISASWRRDWSRLTVFFDYPPAIRKVIYTTNAIESWNYSLRKVLKKRGAFPTDEAILTVRDLGRQRIAKKWTVPVPEWKRALNQFAMIVGDRVPTIE
jgi:transposase-like protein